MLFILLAAGENTKIEGCTQLFYQLVLPEYNTQHRIRRYHDFHNAV